MTRFQIYLLLLLFGVCALVFQALHDSWPIALNSALNESRIFFKYAYEEVSQEKSDEAFVLHLIETNSKNFTIVFNKQKPKRKTNAKNNSEINVSKKSKTLAIKHDKVKRVLLFAYHRSGSSFVGDLLQQNEKSFYSFEPLIYMSKATRIDDNRLDEAFRLIDSIFRCKFDDIKFYADWAKQYQYFFKRNKYLCSVCGYNASICFEPEFLSQTCRDADVNVIKEVRLYMRHLRTLLPKLTELDVRVVYLVRDPRGTHKSRQNIEWCRNETKCSNVGSLCGEMTEDIDEFSELQKLYPNRFTLIRYEDLSTNPYSEAKALFDKLDIPFTSSVQQFIDTHTNASFSVQSDVFSTFRDSKNIAYEWKRALNVSDILRIEHTCKYVLEQFNYEFFDQSNLDLLKK